MRKTPNKTGKPPPNPLSLRLTPEMMARLESAAHATKKKKHTLAQEAIEAAVSAIERNNWKLVVPIEFDVSYVAKRRDPAKEEDTDIQVRMEDKKAHERIAIQAKPK